MGWQGFRGAQKIKTLSRKQASVRGQGYAEGMKLHPDASEELNLETVFGAEGALGELQADEIRMVLESSGIDAIVVGSSALPNLPFEVRVAAERAAEARQILAEALQAGEKALEAEFPPETAGN